MIGQTVTLETVSPAQAVAWLALARPGRKPPAARKVDNFANSITGGAWRPDGGAVRFADNGQLIDGRARLLAIAQSGQIVDAAVIRGIPISDIEATERQLARPATKRAGYRRRMAGKAGR